MRDRKGRAVKLKVGIKYCGGCRPEYDRVAVVSRMKEILKDHVEFVSPDSEEAGCILAVCGCRTACADIALFSDRQIRFITSEEDALAWIEEKNQSRK